MEKLGGDFDFGQATIIVTDYDADKAANTPASTSVTRDQQPRWLSNDRSSTTPASISSVTSTGFTQAQQWSIGFSDVADALWNRMTGSMRQKLREACVEVLKRTDDPSEEEKMAWAYDEDARFLD